jgi:hypothetical protein
MPVDWKLTVFHRCEPPSDVATVGIGARVDGGSLPVQSPDIKQRIEDYVWAARPVSPGADIVRQRIHGQAAPFCLAVRAARVDDTVKIEPEPGSLATVTIAAPSCARACGDGEAEPSSAEHNLACYSSRNS